MGQHSRVVTLAADWRAPFVAIALLSVLDVFQNVYLSGFTDQPGALWKVWIYELSSAAVLLALVPFVSWLNDRFPLRALSPASAAALASASIFFSVIHVATMVAIRKCIFVLFGHHYDFGPPWTGFAYEYGKDAFTFAVFLAAFTFNSWARDSVVRAQKTEGSRLCGGIVVKTMRGTVFVDFASIVRVEASGNYVTLFTADRQFLHRATMKEVAELLPAGDFARTHRSHIVRLIAIRGIRSGPDGEKIVDLPGGAQVPLSRTYATSRSWIVSLHSSGEANHPSVS